MTGNRRLDPFEIVMCLVFGTSAFAQIFNGPAANSSAILMPPVYRVLWLSIMVFGAVLTIIGAVNPKVGGLLIESVGLFAFGLAILIYGVQAAILTLDRNGISFTAALGAFLTLGLAGAFLWKWKQVRADINFLARKKLETSE